jgi:hypothetical protein
MTILSFKQDPVSAQKQPHQKDSLSSNQVQG